MITRAIFNKPSLLFLDEPTSSLDPGTSQEIHKLLRELNSEGTTIFLTTHNMDEADKLLSIHSKEPNLEEIFLKLTGRTL